MAVRYYSPDTSPQLDDVGILLFNHKGSSVLSDTGRDARAWAFALKLPIIAVDRPGSGFGRPGQGKKLANNYADSFKRLVDRSVSPLANKHNLQRIIVAGRSAGALAAHMVAQSCGDYLPIVALNSQESIGWINTTFEKGKRHFVSYMARQEEMVDNRNIELIRPDPTDQIGLARLIRQGAVIINNLVDQSNNTDVWRQNLAFKSALEIADRMPHIRADVFFAETSLVIGPGSATLVKMSLEDIRAQAAPTNDDWQPFNVHIVPNTVHSSFDQRDLSARLLAITVDGLAEPPLHS